MNASVRTFAVITITGASTSHLFAARCPGPWDVYEHIVYKTFQKPLEGTSSLWETGQTIGLSAMTHDIKKTRPTASWKEAGKETHDERTLHLAIHEATLCGPLFSTVILWPGSPLIP